MKYGDAVVLVQKNHSDGSLRRLNAIVLASSLRVPTTADRKVIEGAETAEHLDIAFPVPTLVPDGAVLKTRDMAEIFRPTYDVGPYVEGAWVGYELPETEDEPDRIEGSPREVVEAVQFGAASEEIARLRTDLSNATSIIESLREQAGKDEVSIEALQAELTKNATDGKPSAADLDAAAAEQAAKEATAGNELSPDNAEKPIETVMGVPDPAPQA